MERIRAEDLVGAEWAEWYAMTPEERWRATDSLWDTYLMLGGTLDPEPIRKALLRSGRVAREL